MNMQALLKQAQSMQKDMLKAKEEIDNTIFTGENALVQVEIKENKKIKSIKINTKEAIQEDEIEMLEDMIVVAVNSALKKIDDMTEEKMGKFSNIPGLF